MSDPRVVLVTGASSGVGRAAAMLLAEHGYRVFGTSRDPARAAASPGVELVELDVRSDESVRACVAAVLEKASWLDVLVNNAGYELAGDGHDCGTSSVDRRDRWYASGDSSPPGCSSRDCGATTGWTRAPESERATG